VLLREAWRTPITVVAVVLVTMAGLRNCRTGDAERCRAGEED